MQLGWRVYRVVWLLLCGLLGAVGALAAFTLSLGAVIAALVMAAGVGGFLTWLVLTPEGDNPRLPRGQRRAVAASTALSGGGCVVSIGLGTLLGAPTAVVLVIFAVGGSPRVIRFCVRWLRQHDYLQMSHRQGIAADRTGTLSEPVLEPGADAGSESSAPVRTDASELSDQDLCLAWRASFSALKRSSSPGRRVRIVAERQAYLDELERRSRRGIAVWLASGARAAGDPSPFVLGDSGAGRSPIDWDRLIHGTGK